MISEESIPSQRVEPREQRTRSAQCLIPSPVNRAPWYPRVRQTGALGVSDFCVNRGGAAASEGSNGRGGPMAPSGQPRSGFLPIEGVNLINAGVAQRQRRIIRRKARPRSPFSPIPSARPVPGPLLVPPYVAEPHAIDRARILGTRHSQSKCISRRAISCANRLDPWPAPSTSRW